MLRSLIVLLLAGCAPTPPPPPSLESMLAAEGMPAHRLRVGDDVSPAIDRTGHLELRLWAALHDGCVPQDMHMHVMSKGYRRPADLFGDWWQRRTPEEQAEVCALLEAPR